MNNIKKITIDEFMDAFEALKKFHENGNDPLPEINEKSDLNAILNYPFQSVFGKVLYWGFYKKAACYFYTFSKGHVFANGNKRSGVLAVNLFYEINERECGITDDEMYTLAKYVANSKSADKDAVISHIANVLKQDSK